MVDAQSGGPVRSTATFAVKRWYHFVKLPVSHLLKEAPYRSSGV